MTNEAILTKRVISFPEDDNMTDEAIKRNVYAAMDAARRDEAMELMKWMLKNKFQPLNNLFFDGNDYKTPEQLYSLFKNSDNGK